MPSSAVVLTLGLAGSRAGSARAAAPVDTSNDPRVDLKPGYQRRRPGRAQHGARRDDAEAGGLLRSEAARGRADGRGAARDAGAGDRRPGAAHAPPRRADTRQLRGRADPGAPRRRRPRRASTSRTPTSRSGKADMFIGNFNGFNTYDIESPKKPRLLASVVCPGGQGDMSVYGNLLFMSVEQTRGRIDCGTQGVTDDGQPGALPRRPHLRHHRHQQAEADRRGADAAAARTRTRWSSIRTTRRTSTSTARAPAPVRSGDELAGCSAKDRRRIRTRRSSAST